jgi:uncharacterized protein (TIGR03435 family)
MIGGPSSPAANCIGTCSTREEILSARFDVQATIAEDVSALDQSMVLRTFLMERFKLKTHHEMRELPVYTVTVARQGRLGPQLRRSGHNCVVWAEARKDDARVPEPTDARGRPLCSGQTMRSINEGIYVRTGAGPIASLLSQIQGDLPLMIIDRTDLVGNFEWELSNEMPGLREFVPNLPNKAPTVDIALQEQLGLKLQRTTASLQVLVVDSVSMPTPN